MKWTPKNSSWGNEGCPESSRKSGQATGDLLERAYHCTDRKIGVSKGVLRKWTSLEFRTVQLQNRLLAATVCYHYAVKKF